MKECCLAENVKVVVGGVRFFLGGDKEREELEESSDEEEAIDLGGIKHQMGINKKTKKRAKMMDNAVAKAKKREKKQNKPHPLNFSAFHLLHDPQTFAEKLFSNHLQKGKLKLNLEQKLLVLQLVSRLIGLHKLTIINLYTYFIKYLTPRQPSVTSFLASLAQATHNLVPPDTLEPLVQKIANEFVSEASASEVASAGLNAIREICARQPLAMSEALLQDLVMYKKSKDKGVMMAARGLLSLYREVGADMLKKRDRGKDAAMGLRSGERKERRFGEEAAGEIEGLELLAKWKEGERQRKQAEKGTAGGANDNGEAEHEEEDDDDDDDENDGWEIGSAESDSSGGWIDRVSGDDGTDLVLSDSDSDSASKPAKKRNKLGADADADASVNASAQATEPPSVSQGTDNPTVATASQPGENPTPAPSLATTHILTPADLVKLHDLRLSAAAATSGLPASQRNRLAPSSSSQQRHADDPLTAAQIAGLAHLSRKADKEEKVARAREGKGERAEHRSTQAIRASRKAASGKSSTNKEKARRKNVLM
ncbi:MAG: hypothetical protein LQ340_005351, partial [Diploschistes diacapsis]